MINCIRCNQYIYNHAEHSIWRLPLVESYFDVCCYIAAIAQSVSALDFNFERTVGGFILIVGKKVESEKSECNNSGY